MIVSDHNKNLDYEFRKALDNLYSKSQFGPDDFRKQIIKLYELKINNDPNLPCHRCELGHFGCMGTCWMYNRFIRSKLGLQADEAGPIDVRKLTCDY